MKYQNQDVVILRCKKQLGRDRSGVDLGLYGPSGLGEYVSGELCCGMHRTPEEVCGDSGAALPGVVGDHPAIRLAAGEHGYRQCHAGVAVALKDRGFLQACMDMDIPGFQFSSGTILPSVRKWATGTVIGPRAFGRGYCYLSLFVNEMRARVARILGPVPYVTDVCMLFRLAGSSQAFVGFRSVAEGLYHCEKGFVKKTGRQVFEELLGLIALGPRSRLGIADSSVALLAGRPERFFCEVCGFDVVKLGHEARCRKFVAKDMAAALVGDARHALDVKLLLTQCTPSGTQYTILSQVYISAIAQKEYLEMAMPMLFVEGLSVHSIASRFECLYTGTFRRRYLCWLCADLARRSDVGFDAEEGMRLVYSLGVEDSVESKAQSDHMYCFAFLAVWTTFVVLVLTL